MQDKRLMFLQVYSRKTSWLCKNLGGCKSFKFSKTLQILQNDHKVSKGVKVSAITQIDPVHSPNQIHKYDQKGLLGLIERDHG